jgi:hypothetical protein
MLLGVAQWLRVLFPCFWRHGCLCVVLRFCHCVFHFIVVPALSAGSRSAWVSYHEFQNRADPIAAVFSGIFAVLFVVLVATVVGYFMARVPIDDHDEVNSELMAILIVGPAATGAVVGAVGGGLIARYFSADRS